MRSARPVALLLAIALVLLGLLTALPVSGHDGGPTHVTLTLFQEGRFELLVVTDLDDLALGRSGLPFVLGNTPGTEQMLFAGPSSGLLIFSQTGKEREKDERNLRSLLSRRVKLRIDGGIVGTEVSFPRRLRLQSGGSWPPGGSFFGDTARFSGRLPDGAKEVQVAVSRSFGAVDLVVTRADGALITQQVLGPGERSHPVLLTAIAWFD